MTEETVRAFAERITTDEEFARRLGSVSSPDERLKMANDAGYDLSASDLSAIKTALSVEELSDEDLEKVAGGIGASVGAATATAATAAATLAATIATASVISVVVAAAAI